MRTTVEMSRLLVGLGVPPSVIGKLVTTPPAKITYLDNRDLIELKVHRTNPFWKIYELANLAKNETSEACSVATSTDEGDLTEKVRKRSCATASARSSEDR